MCGSIRSAQIEWSRQRDFSGPNFKAYRSILMKLTYFTLSGITNGFNCIWPPSTSFRNSRLMPRKPVPKEISIGESLQRQIRYVIARRLSNIPRDNISILLPAQEYSVFHRATAGARRIELDGNNREDLIRKALKKQLKHDSFLGSQQELRRPRSETRELSLWNDARALGKWLALQDCGLSTVNGLDYSKALVGGDIAIVHAITILPSLVEILPSFIGQALHSHERAPGGDAT
jgi:hypothetical protein